MGRQLNKTGRPIVYSCSLPAYEEPLGVKVKKHAMKELLTSFHQLPNSITSLITHFWPKFAICGAIGTI